MVKDYDSTVARVAGNIFSGLQPNKMIEEDDPDLDDMAVEWCVRIARKIVEEVKGTEKL